MESFLVREKRFKEEIEKYRQERPKIQQQFSEGLYYCTPLECVVVWFVVVFYHEAPFTTIQLITLIFGASVNVYFLKNNYYVPLIQ